MIYWLSTGMTSYQKDMGLFKQRCDIVIEKPLKPAEFAEKKLLEAILDRTYRPGDSLPAERQLAELMGVTRPTLRETLQRLSREGWVKIRQGKPTRVNDYLKQGGLGMLRSLAAHGQTLSNDMISHLLDVRITLFPGVAQKAVSNDPEPLLTFLEQANGLKDDAKAFAEFDWGLQMQMIHAAQNPVFHMMFNDFKPLYHMLGETYFKRTIARKASRQYYMDLTRAMRSETGKEMGDTVKQIVEDIMVHSLKIWQDIQ